MGKGKPKVEVTEFYMSQHFGVCLGPVDALTRIVVKEKDAFVGEQTEEGALTLSNENLFGGIKKEGGIRGIAHWLPGFATQILPDNLAQKLGRASGIDAPAYRGIASLFFHDGGRGFYWAANSPFLPGVWATVRRILRRADGSEQWYPEKAGVDPNGAAEPVFDTDTWRYLVGIDPESDFPGTPGPIYNAEDFDDSDWETDVMPFGTQSADLEPDWPNSARKPAELGFRNVPSGPFPIERILHLRKTITLETQIDSLTFQAFINNAMELWVNGELVFAIEPAGSNYINEVVPGSFFRVGVNSIYIRAMDLHVGAHEEIGFIDIRQASIATGDMNPAHIIHEALTDNVWGMGTPVAALSDSSFRNAADALFDEGFGLSVMWTRQTSIESFVSEILDHIQAVLFTDPLTGLLTLKLIRGDYDADTLPILTPDNADLSNFQRKLWGDIVNTMTVTWTNPVNEKEETVTAQDIASIATQGGEVSDSRNFYGIRNAALAQKVAWRELLHAGQPLASVDAVVDRSEYNLTPGAVIKLSWPEYGIDGIVFRVLTVDYGKPGDMELKLSLMEDVYGLDVGTYAEPPRTIWQDPSQLPSAAEFVEILTLPYFLAASSVVADFADSPEYPEVVAGVLASSSNTDAYEYELWTELAGPSGDVAYEASGVNTILGRAQLVASLPREAESLGIILGPVIGATEPAVGGFVFIGEGDEDEAEIAMVTAVGAGTFDVARGVMDTVPRAWPIGTPLRFIDTTVLIEDREVRTAGEEVEYKLLVRTSRGLLSLAVAPVETAVLSERPYLPNRPANVAAYGASFTTRLAPVDARMRADPWVAVTWSIRNRLLEDAQILRWTDAGLPAEVGQTTTIEVWSLLGVLLATHDGLTGETFDVPDASFADEAIVELRLYSERTDDDGEFVSFTSWSEFVQLADEPYPARLLESGELRIDESGEVRRLED